MLSASTALTMTTFTWFKLSEAWRYCHFFGRRAKKRGGHGHPVTPMAPALGWPHCCHNIVEALLKMLECLTTLAVLECSFCWFHPVLPHDCTTGNTFDCFHNQQDSQKKHRESTESETASSFLRWAMLNTAWSFTMQFSHKNHHKKVPASHQKILSFIHQNQWASSVLHVKAGNKVRWQDSKPLAVNIWLKMQSSW